MDSKSLVLDGKTIGMDEHGRYSANDVHRLSGGAEKHKPNKYLRLEGTKELIEVLDSDGDRSVPLSCVHVSGTDGCQATYLSEDMLIDYAANISVRFKLKVYAAFKLVYGVSQTGQEDTDSLSKGDARRGFGWVKDVLMDALRESTVVLTRVEAKIDDRKWLHSNQAKKQIKDTVEAQSINASLFKVSVDQQFIALNKKIDEQYSLVQAAMALLGKK